jgi:tripartite-type tricarboxylate transporter receptor subunit TctC
MPVRDLLGRDSTVELCAKAPWAANGAGAGVHGVTFPPPMTEEVTMSAAHALAAGALALLSAAAGAQTYPTKPIRVVVPFAAGGPADVYARVLGRSMQETLGQAFVVENRPGGGSLVGTDVVAKAPADGYTLLLMSNTHTVNESLLPKKPFQLMRDFAPISPINYSDLVLVIHPSVGIDSVKRLLAMAKSRPGVLNYASSGPGTPYHMAGELFKSMAKVDIVHVPYKRATKPSSGSASWRPRERPSPSSTG